MAVRQGRSFFGLPNLRLLSFDSEILFEAQELVEEYALKPRDAIHAATAMRNKITEILSYDADFDVLPSIKRKEP